MRCLLLLFLFLPGTLLAQRRNAREGEKGAVDGSQAEYYFAEGMKYYLLESYPKALDLFRRSLEVEPEKAGVNYAMASALSRLDRAPEAIPYAEKAVRLDESNKFNYLLLGNLYESEKNFSQAIKVYQELLKRQPTATDAYHRLAALYGVQGRTEEALRLYQRLETLTGADPEVSYQKQLLFLKLNRLDEALAEGRKLVAAYPEETEHALYLAEILVSNGRKAEAIRLLEDVVAGSTNPQAQLLLYELRQQGQAVQTGSDLEKVLTDPALNAESKLNLLTGWLSSSHGNSQEALRLAQLVVQHHPGEASPYAFYAGLLRLNNQLTGARDAYARAARLDGAVFENWLAVVELDAELDQPDSLLHHAEKALELYPAHAIFWYYQGYAQLRQQQYVAAIESLTAAKDLAVGNPRVLAEAQARLGDVFHATGKYAQSDEAYEAALALQPDNATVLNNYSYYLALRREKLDRARTLSARLVEQHPDNATFLDTHAWVLYQLKEFKLAVKLLEKAAARNPSGTVLEHYGDALFQVGEKEQAVAQWIRAKQAGANGALIDKKIASKALYE